MKSKEVYLSWLAVCGGAVGMDIYQVVMEGSLLHGILCGVMVACGLYWLTCMVKAIWKET